MEWTILGVAIASTANDPTAADRFLSLLTLLGSMMVPIMCSFLVAAMYSKNKLSKPRAMTVWGLNAIVLAFMVLITLKMNLVDTPAIIASMCLGLSLINAVILRRK